MINFLKFLVEGLTIPPNQGDPVEEKLYAVLKDGDRTYADSVVRWYRNTKDEDAEKAKGFVENIDNILDSLVSLRTTLDRAKDAGLEGSVRVSSPNGGTVEIDMYKGATNKYFTFDQAVEFMRAVAVKVREETVSAEDTQKKYVFTPQDCRRVRLLGSSEHFVCWATEDYKTTNKFVYHLWQNADTLGLGEVWGDPSVQTPYCTHSKEHWDKAAAKCDNAYTQFWFLKKVDGVQYKAGDLMQPAVREAFKAMRGKGAALLDCMTDTNGECLNSYDQSYCTSQFTNFENSKEIRALAGQVLDCDVVQKVQLGPFVPMLFAKGAGRAPETVRPIDPERRSFDYTENALAQMDVQARDIMNRVDLRMYEDSIVKDGRIVADFPEGINLSFGGNLLKSVTSFEGLPARMPERAALDHIGVTSFKDAPDFSGVISLSMTNCDNLESFAGFKKISDNAYIYVSGKNLRSLDGAPSNAGSVEIGRAALSDAQMRQYAYYLALKGFATPGSAAAKFVEAHTNEYGNYREQPLEDDVDALRPAATAVRARLEGMHGRYVPCVKFRNSDVVGDDPYATWRGVCDNAEKYRERLEDALGLKYCDALYPIAENQLWADLENGVAFEDRMARPVEGGKEVADAVRFFQDDYYGREGDGVPAYEWLFPDEFAGLRHGGIPKSGTEDDIRQDISTIAKLVRGKTGAGSFDGATIENCVEKRKEAESRKAEAEDAMTAESVKYVARNIKAVFDSDGFRRAKAKFDEYAKFIEARSRADLVGSGFVEAGSTREEAEKKAADAVNGMFDDLEGCDELRGRTRFMYLLNAALGFIEGEYGGDVDLASIAAALEPMLPNDMPKPEDGELYEAFMYLMLNPYGDYENARKEELQSVKYKAEDLYAS